MVRRHDDRDHGLWFQPQPPVRWLAPRELIDAGLRVALSGAFGEYADKRELMQLFACDTFAADGPPSETWVDYVADLGDGFDATYSVARLIAARRLNVADGDGEVTLPRASTVILGGDQVYPTADIDTYTNRLEGPFQAALDHTEPPHPWMFAIPGNHDWYDGLTSFVRVICSGTWLGGWKLPQHRSYFAVQLTPGWWLWGIDIQFDGYIDQYQIEYFRRAAEQLDDAGVVLCSAKPSWARAAHDGERPTPSMRNLDYFVDRCFDDDRFPDGPPVRLQLAGDWHHYARYVDDATGDQYVTSGGGGAYTSATHQLADRVTLRRNDAADDATLELQPVTYPDSTWSVRRRWNAIFAGWWNPAFAYLAGAVYLLLGVVTLSSAPLAGSFAERVEALRPRDAFEAYWTGLVSSPVGWVLIGVFGAGLIGLTGIRKLQQPWRGGVAGALHTGAHLVVASVCVWAGVLVASWFGDPTDAVTWIVWSLVVFATGTVFGSATFGGYLGLADWFGAINTNELFAAQRIEGHKQFLRMRITDAEIEVYVVGFDECPRWEPDPDADRSTRSDRFRRVDDPDAARTAPRLVDRFTIGRHRP